ESSAPIDRIVEDPVENLMEPVEPSPDPTTGSVSNETSEIEHKEIVEGDIQNPEEPNIDKSSSDQEVSEQVDESADDSVTIQFPVPSQNPLDDSEEKSVDDIVRDLEKDVAEETGVESVEIESHIEHTAAILVSDSVGPIE